MNFYGINQQVIQDYLSSLPQSRRTQILETLQRYPPPNHFWKVINLRWLRGFIQGDGTFNISYLYRRDRIKRIQVQCQFGITQHKISLFTLLGARILLGTGQIYFQKDRICDLKVTSRVELNQKIMSQFYKNGFFGKTQFRYIFVSQVVQSHFEGAQPQHLKNFIDILNVALAGYNKHRKYSLTKLLSFMEQRINKKLLDYIQKQYQNNKLIPLYQSSICEQFVAGFTDAEGCFMILLKYRASMWPLIQVHLEFRLCAEASEVKILKSIDEKFFQNSGKIYYVKSNSMAELRYTKLNQILEVVIPFFLLNPVISSKYYDFEKFVTVAYMKKANKHKTIKGMQEIIKLAFQSNSGKYGQQSTRHHSKAQYLQFLSIAPDKQVWKDMKHIIPSLKKKIMVSRLQQKQ